MTHNTDPFQDSQLSDLFANFRPQLPSTELFSERLRLKMEAIDIVQQKQKASKTRYRAALIAASVSGCIVGLLLGLMIPNMMRLISNLHFPAMILFDFDITTVAIWSVMVSATVTLSINVFSLVNSRLQPGGQSSL